MRRAACLVLLLALGARYPPPSDPGEAGGRPNGKTRLVCGKAERKGCFPTIQDAVDRARPGDTVRVPKGTYRESIRISGPRKRYLRLVGEGAVLEGSGERRNGVVIDRAERVTVTGFEARDFEANGFLVRRSRGPTLRDLAATNNGTGFSLQGTPSQVRPVRSMVRRLRASGNVVGFRGAKMRYVTLTGSLFVSNRTGILITDSSDSTVTGNRFRGNDLDVA